MSMYLFSTPVQCTNCGTVVDDPKTDRCPKCQSILRERRTPSRLAGVDQRYGGVRFLVGTLRFLGIIIILVAGLIFAFGVGTTLSAAQSGLTVLGGVLTAVFMFAIAAFFDVILDMEENTRAAFRLQQMILDELQRGDEAPASAPPIS